MTEWFRSWHGAPTDPKWLAVARRAKVDPIVVVGIVWALLDEASQAKDRGSIAHFDPEVFAALFNLPVNDVENVILALREKKILVEDRFGKWDERQPIREDTSTDRWRRWKDRKNGPEPTPTNATQREPTHTNAAQTHANAAQTHANAPDTESESERGESTPPLNPPTHALPSVERASRAREAKNQANSKRKKKTAISPEWRPTPAQIAELQAEGLTDPAAIEREVRAFVDWNLARDNRVADWPAAWRGWARRAADLARGPPAGQSRTTPAQETQNVLDQHRRAAQARKAAGAASGN